EKQFTKGVEPMKFRIGEMTVGDILDRGLKLLFSRLGTFYTINLIVLLPVLAFQLAMPELGLASDEYKLLIGLWISLLLTLLLFPIGTAAILHVIGKEFVDEPVTIGAALGRAFPLFFPLLGTSILVGLVISLALVGVLVVVFILSMLFGAAGG